MISRAGSFRPGFFFVRNILSGGAFSLCETSFRAGFFLVCAGLSLVRGFPLCGVPSVRGSFRAGFFSVRGFFRAGFSSATRTGAIAGRVSACSGPRPLSRALFPVPSFPSPLSRPLFPVPDTCRRARPDVPRVEPFPACLPAGGRCRALFSACCVRAVARAGPSFPRSVFDSLLKSPGPVLGIPPNFSYLWMQKMSFAALKTYRTE